MSFSKTSPIEATAAQAIGRGREVAALWPQVTLKQGAAQAPLLADSLARFAAGEAFCANDEAPLSQMLATVAATLDDFRAGYGRYFLTEWTGEAPFFDAKQEAVRCLGEVLKAFIAARSSVLDTVLAERQLRLLREG